MSTMDRIPLNDQRFFSFISGLWKGNTGPFKSAAVLRSTNFRGDGLLDYEDIAILEVEQRQLNSRRLQRGDIVIERSGGGPKQPVGRVAMFDPPDDSIYATSNFTTALRVEDRERFDPDYVCLVLHALYLSGATETLQRATTGIRNLDWAEYQSFQIPRPPIEDQKAIAGFIKTARQGVLIEDIKIKTLAVLKRGTMHELFTRGLRGEMQKETEIGLVPESWTVGPIGGFTQFQRGFDITKDQQEKGDVPVVSSGGVKSYHNVARVKGPGVIIGRKGSIGLIHYIDSDYWPHDTTLWSKAFLGNLPKFVYYRLHSVNMKRLDSGATNPALNRNFLHEEFISWPSADEQGEIVAILDAIDRKIDLHRRKRAVLNELFKALLHKLMTGEIRVADLDLSALAGNGAKVAA